jgi:predicted amidohydrolase
MIAAAQVGQHNEKRESYGHSLVYDPMPEDTVVLELLGSWTQQLLLNLS